MITTVVHTTYVDGSSETSRVMSHSSLETLLRRIYAARPEPLSINLTVVKR